MLLSHRVSIQSVRNGLFVARLRTRVPLAIFPLAPQHHCTYAVISQDDHWWIDRRAVVFNDDSCFCFHVMIGCNIVHNTQAQTWYHGVGCQKFCSNFYRKPMSYSNMLMLLSVVCKMLITSLTGTIVRYIAHWMCMQYDGTPIILLLLTCVHGSKNMEYITRFSF